jgi:hypothetical protein
MGENVHLLARPLEVKGEANVLRGAVVDVVFQRDGYKVMFDSGLYVHLPNAPKIGKRISARVRVECLA